MSIITTTSDRLEVIHSGSDGDGAQMMDVSTDQAEGPGPDVADVQASNRPTFTITDAATSCSVSRKTITRKLAELAIHGAAKDDDGVWRIPVEALLAVGLHPGRSMPEAGHAAVRPAAPAPVPVRPVDQDTITIPRDRWDDVRIRLARAEAEASERGLALADARLALRALTAGPATRERAAELVTDPNFSAPPGARAEFPGQVSTGAASNRVGATATGGDPAAADQGNRDASGSVHVEVSRDAPVPERGQPELPDVRDTPAADVVAARNLAARTGGYVPAVPAPVKKRRWWQSR
jgi:hypothetical protein